MKTTPIARKLEELKASAVARARRRRAEPHLDPDILRRLEALERVAAEVGSVLDELAGTLPGLAVTRRLGHGSRVLEATGAARAAVPGMRARRTWSRLEFRLELERREPGRLWISSHATVCDADLPGEAALLDLRTGALAGQDARAFAESCALVFARALFARRAELSIDTADEGAADPDAGV